MVRKERDKMQMENLKVVSLNTRGIGNALKRRKVFRYMKRFNADICLLQETHCDKKNESQWTSEWGTKCVFASGTSSTKGVAVLMSKHCSGKLSDVIRDPEGRYLMCKFTFNEYTYCVANVYARNNNSKNFFNNFFNLIESMECVHVIVGGDFNVVQNCKLDRNIEKTYNQTNLEEIQQAMQQQDLLDIWRERNPEKRSFTWMRSKQYDIWSRIDYFLVSQSLNASCTKTEIVPSVQSDHSMITMEFELCECE